MDLNRNNRGQTWEQEIARETSAPYCETIPIGRGLEMAFGELATKAEHNPKTKAIGISTGYKEIDESTGGLRNGQLTVLSGRICTHEFAINIALNAAKAGARIYYFSMSRSLPVITQSFIAIEAGIEEYRIWSGHMREVDWQNLADTTGRLSNLDIIIIDNPSVTCDEIVNTITIASKNKKNVLVVVDTLDQMGVPEELRQKSRAQQVAGIVQELQKAAVSINVPILALSGIAHPYTNELRRPRIEDMEYAEPIKLYADVVMLLDLCMGSIEEDMDGRPALNEAWIFVDKNRNQTYGLIGNRLSFNRATAAFTEHVCKDKPLKPNDEEGEWEDIAYEELMQLLVDR